MIVCVVVSCVFGGRENGVPCKSEANDLPCAQGGEGSASLAGMSSEPHTLETREGGVWEGWDTARTAVMWAAAAAATAAWRAGGGGGGGVGPGGAREGDAEMPNSRAPPRPGGDLISEQSAAEAEVMARLVVSTRGKLKRCRTRGHRHGHGLDEHGQIAATMGVRVGTSGEDQDTPHCAPHIVHPTLCTPH